MTIVANSPRNVLAEQPLAGRTDGSGAALECSGVWKSFGRVPAVAGLELSVAEGRILALLGPSGCGKTTTLRLIAGFERPDEGEVRIGDRRVSSPTTVVPPERRNIGMVFQEGALFPHLTVEQNVAYGLRKYADRAERIAAALDLVGLSELGSRLPHELSGGQQQRVALGRALAPGPSLLLMDEPFSNLDAKLAQQLRRDVAEIVRDSGVTTVFVTHDQDAALQVGDEVALMNEGRVEQIATPARIFHSPETKYAAEFLGTVDFLPVDMVDGNLASELGPLGEDFQSADLAQLPNLEIMVRPDCIECLPDVGGNAVIVEREFRGAFYLYRVQMPSGSQVRCLMSHIVEMSVGMPVSVRLRNGHRARLFTDGSLVESTKARV